MHQWLSNPDTTYPTLHRLDLVILPREEIYRNHYTSPALLDDDWQRFWGSVASRKGTLTHLYLYLPEIRFVPLCGAIQLEKLKLCANNTFQLEYFPLHCVELDCKFDRSTGISTRRTCGIVPG